MERVFGVWDLGLGDFGGLGAVVVSCMSIVVVLRVYGYGYGCYCCNDEYYHYHHRRRVFSPCETGKRLLCSLFLLLVEPRQAEPHPQYTTQQRQNNRLQHLHALCLCNGSDCEGEDGGARPADRGCESDRTDVQMAWEEFCGGYDGGGEKGAEEETLKCDGDGRDVELRDEPEDEFEGHGEGEVNLEEGVLEVSG